MTAFFFRSQHKAKSLMKKECVVGNQKLCVREEETNQCLGLALVSSNICEQS
jgi:hypothetical protein